HYRNYVSVYYEDYKDVFNRYNEAINNAVKNVTKSVDKFEFDTDYEQDRFVITQVAYTKGWKISAIDENGNKTQLKTYNAQGGFVGFVAPKGNYHYEMTYFTPYLKEGLIISITSFVLFVGTSTGIVIYNHSKKNKKEFE
ncbi:MAG: YfhO family protein, partial [Bacillales bacterium]|nr:YfhO family protein [Bacillales bacterium]